MCKQVEEQVQEQTITKSVLWKNNNNDRDTFSEDTIVSVSFSNNEDQQTTNIDKATELWEEIKEKIIQLREIFSGHPDLSMSSQTKINKFLDLQSSCNEEQEKGLVIDDDKSEPDANLTLSRTNKSQEQANEDKNTALTRNICNQNTEQSTKSK